MGIEGHEVREKLGHLNRTKTLEYQKNALGFKLGEHGWFKHQIQAFMTKFPNSPFHLKLNSSTHFVWYTRLYITCYVWLMIPFFGGGAFSNFLRKTADAFENLFFFNFRL